MTTTAVETSGGERIDELVSTVRTKAWLAAVALILVAGCGAGWAWLGQVRDVVFASGVLVTGTGPVPVAAPVSGSLAEVFVTAGQEVTAGTPLAVLSDAQGARRVVTGTSSGRVIRTAAPGTALAAGAVVAVVDPGTGPLRAVLTVGPERIGSLTEGQTVAVTGAGTGKVSAVDAYPTSTDRLRPLYGDTLKADGRYLVTVDLDRPAWPGATLTPVAGEITVAVVRPVDALFKEAGRG
ncbi:biotin/lipoyl-binding protein [Herbidospora mongoliensis]|uniref:biotin/lipoyl-binding protein n=1 Tax=Herbidospora mongoliensis TaxID=688067 RepID=UPI000836C113|nr:biotin/lipoyl-binding protein [Herbidospora mongoliensis]